MIVAALFGRFALVAIVGRVHVADVLVGRIIVLLPFLVLLTRRFEFIEFETRQPRAEVFASAKPT